VSNLSYFAIEPESGKFIIADSPERVRAFAQMQFENKFMVTDENGFNAIMNDQLRRGHKMTEIICVAPEPMRNPVYASGDPIQPTIPNPSNDIDEEKEREKDVVRKEKMGALKQRFLQNLSNPEKVEHKPFHPRRV